MIVNDACKIGLLVELMIMEMAYFSPLNWMYIIYNFSNSNDFFNLVLRYVEISIYKK